MTIDEAIKILTQMGMPDFRGHTENILAARKLGIKALKQIKDMRDFQYWGRPTLLPGETEKKERRKVT